MKTKLILSIFVLSLANYSLNYSMDPNEMLINGAGSSDLNLIKNALIKGANINCKDKSGFTALMRSYNTEIIKFLIDSGADVNIKSQSSRTALGFQFLFNDQYPKKKLDNIKLLLEAGADLSIIDNQDRNVIEQAKDYPHQQIEVIECLIDYLKNQKQKIKTEVDVYLPTVLMHIVDEYLFDKEIK